MARKLKWVFPATITQIEVKNPWMVVRSCLNGIDEQGQIIKTLYCTHNGRFFVSYADGWHKLEPSTTILRQKQKLGYLTAPKRGGSSDCPIMRHFGHYRCHRLVAYAWCEHPACAKTDPEWYKHYEADHINGDHGNWTADNLRWVTPAQNRAWGVRSRRLKKLGLNLKWIRPDLLVAISDISQGCFEYFMVRLPEVMKADERPMSHLTLTDDVSKALCKTMVVEVMKADERVMSHLTLTDDDDDADLVECARCGTRIPFGEAYSTHYGYLCDICYGDLYD